MKNAVLIAAHDKYDQLKMLLSVLDDKSVDIFIHINKKSEMPDISGLTENIKFSKIHFVGNRVPIVWGGPGILYAELELLKTAKNVDRYDYYHFITGQDFPIKDVTSIIKFLEDNLFNNCSNGLKTNYIIANEPEKIYRSRIENYNYFIPHYRDKNILVRSFYRGTNKILRYFQKILRINRLKNSGMKLFFGSSWWSITDDFSDYVLSKEKAIKDLFDEYTFAADEFALQTLIENSPFKDSKYLPDDERIAGNLRLLDFSTGNGLGSPHVYTERDYAAIKQSSNLWARKFDKDVDIRVINMLIADMNKYCSSEGIL